MARKRKLLMSLFVCALFVLVTMPAIAAPIVSIGTPVASPTVGSLFDVFVNVSAVPTGIYAFEFDIGFNPAVMSAVNITEGTLLPTSGTTLFIAGSIDNTLGSIDDTADTLTGSVPGAVGPGNLAIVRFNALASGNSPITLSNLIILDSSLNAIQSEMGSGSVNIVTNPPSCTNGDCGPPSCTNGDCPHVSEPTTMLLLGLGLIGITGIRKRMILGYRTR